MCISRQLAEHKFEKSGEQCRCKVKKLRQEYKKIKDSHGKTGTGRSKWKFYNGINEILGNRPATCPPVIIDTLNEETLGIQVEDSDNLLENVDDLSCQPSPGNPEEKSDLESIRSRSSTPVNCGKRQNDSCDVEPSNHSRSSTPVNTKQRKRSRGEMVEDIVTKMIKSVTEGLKKSDKMFIELETKRMKFEEEQ